MSKIVLLYEMKKKLSAAQLEKEMLINKNQTSFLLSPPREIEALDALIRSMERQIEHVKNLSL